MKLNKPIHHSQRERQRFITGLFFILPSALLVTVFVLVPCFNVIYYSFTDWNGVATSPKTFVGLQNYANLLTGISDFGTMMIATLVFALGMTAITILVAFAAALALDKKGRGRVNRGFLRSAWFFPTLLSGTVVGVLWRIMYNYNNGMINKVIVKFGGEPINFLQDDLFANFNIYIKVFVN